MLVSLKVTATIDAHASRAATRAVCCKFKDRSGFLAFGFFPSPPNPEPIGGDIFFNDNFRWEVGNALGLDAYDLTLLAAHEIGHALGLDHSTTPDALMRPFFSAADVFVGFHPDDVAGIRSLYAAVPEPSTLLLASVGLVALVTNLIRRSRTRNSD